MFRRNQSSGRSLKVLWCGQFLAMASLEMSGPFWPVYLKSLAGLEQDRLLFWSGAIYAAPMVSAILSAPFWGWVGEKTGHKPMVLRSLLALAMIQAAIALSTSVEIILIWRLCQGACAGVIAATMAYAVSIGDTVRRGRILTSLQGSTAAGSLIGPVLGGLVIAHIGYTFLFFASAAACLFITLAFAIMLKPDRVTSSAVAEKLNGKQDLIGFSFEARWLIALSLGCITLTQFAKMIPQAFFALYVEEIAGEQPVLLGVVFALTGFGVLVSAPVWGRCLDLLSVVAAFALLSMISLIAAITMIGMGHAETLTLLGLLRFVWGVCLGALLPGLLKILNHFAGVSGRMVGFSNSFSKFGNLCGFLCGGIAASLFGFSGAFTGMAVLYGLLALVLGLALLFLRQTALPHSLLFRERTDRA